MKEGKDERWNEKRKMKEKERMQGRKKERIKEN